MSGIGPCAERASVALRSVLKLPAKVAGRTVKRYIWKVMMYADKIVWPNLDGLGSLDG